MSILHADIRNLEAVESITIRTIKNIFPLYYPKGAVDFFLDYHSTESILKDIQDGLVYLNYTEDHAAGTITVRKNEICRLFVLPEYQGQGIGRELLDFAESKIAEQFQRVQLDASLPAKSIYLKRGYMELESHAFQTESGDFLYYDVLQKGLNQLRTIKTKENRLVNMDYSRKISERLWNVPDKGELESCREQTFIDDIIQKSHIEKELLKRLAGGETVFDGGAGCGRFSILLAKHGCKVTHFDISQPMIDKAKELAEKAGVLDHITFVKGALEDLTAYPDQSFDFVISFDSPVSYTYPNQERVICNLVRMAKKQIMLSVSSRLGSLPYLANPLQKNQFILDENCDDPWVKWCLENRKNAVDTFSFDKEKAEELMSCGLMGGKDEIDEYEQGGAPWCITYTFLPDELTEILRRFGVKNIHLAGPGAFARTIPNELLVKIMSNPHQRSDFLDFCYQYDSNPFVCGMGKDNLLAIGEL